VTLGKCHLTSHDQADDEDCFEKQDGRSGSQGPCRIDGAGFGESHHLQNDRIVGKQDRQEAQKEFGQQLTTSLQD
jgi:hypothetical protein